MKELKEKYEEAVYRLNKLRRLEISEKIEKGEKILDNFRNYLNDKFPIYVLGDDKIIEVLRKHESEPLRYRILNNTIEFPSSEQTDSVIADKNHINDTLHAIIYEERLSDIVASFKSDLTCQEILEEVNQLDDTQSKIDFLTDLKFSEKIKSMPMPSRVELFIEDEIVNLEDKNSTTSSTNHEVTIADNQISNFIEVIDAIYRSHIIVDKKSNNPAKLSQIIDIFQDTFHINLSNYQTLRKKALLAHKRAADGKTFLKKLLDIQKEGIQNLLDKDSK